MKKVLTLGDLDSNKSLEKVKVRLPESEYECSSLPGYGIKTRNVYIKGPMMGDFFVKTNLRSTQVYPLFRNSIPWDELKRWEVVNVCK